jgi:hypothetical protein
MAMSAMTWRALVGLYAPTSMEAQIRHTGATFGYWLSALVLVATIIGWADIIGQDVLRYKLLPKMSDLTRKRFCTLYYAAFAGLFFVIAMATVNRIDVAHLMIAAYHLAVGVGCALISIAIVREKM